MKNPSYRYTSHMIYGNMIHTDLGRITPKVLKQASFSPNPKLGNSNALPGTFLLGPGNKVLVGERLRGRAAIRDLLGAIFEATLGSRSGGAYPHHQSITHLTMTTLPSRCMYERIFES